MGEGLPVRGPNTSERFYRHRTDSMRTSENSVKAKFAESTFHALGRIGAVLLTNLAKHRCRHTEARSRHRGCRLSTAAAARPPWACLRAQHRHQDALLARALEAVDAASAEDRLSGSSVLPFLVALMGGDQGIEHVKPHAHHHPDQKAHPQRRGCGPPPQGAGDEGRAEDEADRPQRGPHGVVRGMLPVLLLVDQREACNQYRREGGEYPPDRLREGGPDKRRDYRDRAAEGETDREIPEPSLPDPPRSELGDEVVAPWVVPGRGVAHLPPTTKR